jgi:hypothetical protein
MGLYVQDRENHVLAKTFRPISGGDGTFALTATTQIPKTAKVTIGIAMFKDLHSDSIVAMPHEYKVVSAKRL